MKRCLMKFVATEAHLNEWLFEKDIAEVIFLMADGVEVGFALFFITFPHFLEMLEYILKIFL